MKNEKIGKPKRGKEKKPCEVAQEEEKMYLKKGGETRRKRKEEHLFSVVAYIVPLYKVLLSWIV